MRILKTRSSCSKIIRAGILNIDRIIPSRLISRKAHQSSSVFPFGWSFCGGGFLGAYHIGVWDALDTFYGTETCTVKQLYRFGSTPVIGSSAGSIVAVCIACDIPKDVGWELMIGAIKETCGTFGGVLNPKHDLLCLVRQSLEETLPSDAAELCNGRAHVCITNTKGSLAPWNWEFITLNKFQTKEDVIDAVCCSSYIPWFTSKKKQIFRGQRHYFDGGALGNWPHFNSDFARETIYVSPFVGNFEVSPLINGFLDWGPSIQIPSSERTVKLCSSNSLAAYRAMFPSSDMKHFRTAGFNDCLRFLEELEI